MSYLRKLMLILPFLLSFASAATPSVYHYTLKNGLQIYIKPSHRAPMVVSQIWYKVGSSYEPAGLTGISHALEHMMFEGTSTVPDGQFNAIITQHGGQLNAFTAQDFTAYYEILPAKYLSVALSLEADRMQHLIINQKRFNKEIQVVKEERRMRTENNPQAYAYERFNAAAYIASPYHHPVVGWMDDLNRMNADDLSYWYEKWYTPNNASIVIVGDVDPEKTLDLLKKYFSNIPNRKAMRIVPQASVKSLGERQLTVKLPAKLPFLLMGYNVPVVKTAKLNWQPYALLVLTGVLDAGDSSRLPNDIVRGQQLAASVDVNYNLFSRLNNLVVFSAVPNLKHQVKQIKKALMQELKSLADKPVTQSELMRVKTQMLAAYVFDQDSLENQASTIGALVSVGLPWQLSEDYIKNVEAVTAQEVQAVAKKYFDENRLTVAILKPLPMTAEDAKKQAQAGAGYDKTLH